MRITFVCPSGEQPIGGVTALYEFAGALHRRGHDVRLIHLPMWGREASPSALARYTIEPGITQHFEGRDAPEDVEDSDVVFGTEAPDRLGLPVLLVQGFEMLHPEIERRGYRTPSLKLCIASWLVDTGLRYGVSPDEFHVVPMGIDHDLYRVRVPLDERPPQVAMLHSDHPAKGWDVGFAALVEAKRRVPELRASVFGTRAPSHDLPDWVTFTLDPDAEHLASEIYDRSRVFVQASHYEGFGFTAVEAMACGAALVTTDNGGSRDYAFHGETALVVPTGDVDGLADGIATLLRDDELRTRLATAGEREVRRFDWDEGGAIIERHLLAYLADPAAYLREPGPELPGTGALDQGAVAVRTVTAGPRRSMRPDAATGDVPARPTEASLVFNLVWTGRVFDDLGLFTESLLAHSEARLRFIANACPPDQLVAMERFGERHPGRIVEVVEVSRDRMVRHGEALDRILGSRDDGEHFCLIDPDIIARGPYLGPFLDLVAVHDAVSSGKEVWSDDNVRPADHIGVNGEYFFDQDGFVFGSPHLALYRAERLRATVERWGIGFATAGNDLPDEARTRLKEVGRDFWVYDTGKIVNILLQADGGSLVHVENPDLVHIGGVSHYLAPPSSVGDGEARWGEEPDWGAQKGQGERFAVARFTAMALHELTQGRPAPDIPDGIPDDSRRRLTLVRDTVVELVEAHGGLPDRAASQ